MENEGHLQNLNRIQKSDPLDIVQQVWQPTKPMYIYCCNHRLNNGGHKTPTSHISGSFRCYSYCRQGVGQPSSSLRYYTLAYPWSKSFPAAKSCFSKTIQLQYLSANTFITTKSR